MLSLSAPVHFRNMPTHLARLKAGAHREMVFMSLSEYKLFKNELTNKCEGTNEIRVTDRNQAQFTINWNSKTVKLFA